MAEGEGFERLKTKKALLVFRHQTLRQSATTGFGRWEVRFVLALLIATLVAIPAGHPTQASAVPPPRDLNAMNVAPGSVSLTWNEDPNDNNLAPITHFLVHSSQGVTLTVPTWTLEAIVTGLSSVSTTFTVEAFSGSGSAASAPSLPIAPLAIPPGSPGPPTGVSAQAGLNSALVTWTPPGGGNVSAYRVFAANDNIGVYVTGGSATAAKVTGVCCLATNFLVVPLGLDGSPGSGATSDFVRPQAGGRFHSLRPSRVLDTRDGTGGVPTTPLGANSTLNVPLGGHGGVPVTGVTAVVVNATVTDTTGSSFLTIWPGSTQRPLSSNLNWVPGETVANLGVEPIALLNDISLNIYNLSGSTDVVFDVAGWVGDSSDTGGADGYFNPLPPARLLDTRNGPGPVGPGQSINLQVTGVGGIPSSGVSAVALNVTAAEPTDSSYLTAWPAGSSKPLASNLNFVRGQTVPNRVMVQVGTGGQVSLFNFFGMADVVVDVNGWFTDTSNPSGGSGLTGVGPVRIEDTRTSNGPQIGALGPGQTFSVGLLAVNDFAAAVLNVTATNPTNSSYLTLYPDDVARPLASDLNFVPGQTVPNLTVVKVGPPRQGIHGWLYNNFTVFNFQGSVDVVIDLEAAFTLPVPPLLVSSAVPTVKVGSPAVRLRAMPMLQTPGTRLASRPGLTA